MRRSLQILVISLTLLSFGAAKLKFEHRLNKDLVDQQLIQPPLKQGTSIQLGQTGAAVALGGLRSLIASIWNLRAFHHFENLDWIKLEESYNVITALQPQTTTYWKTGAWHLHTNASVYYNEHPNLSPMRQSQMRQKYIQKGSTLLEEATDINPDNWLLHIELARLWSDKFKTPDLPKAIKHFKDALACESFPSYERAKTRRFLFYTMTRSAEHSKEAYKLGLSLYKESDINHTPNLICCLFSLQNLLNIDKTERISNKELFPTESQQLRWLKNYWKNRELGYPMHGVRTAISRLEELSS